MPLRGDRLRQLRLSRGFTQEALAEKLNLGIRQIHRYERGLSDPSGNIVAKIAKELDVTTDYLLGLSDLPNNQPSEQALTTQEQLLLTAYRHREVALLVQIINAELGQAPDGLPGAIGDGQATTRRRRRRSPSNPPQPQR
jgi:transcriptional regulator with XRE-family HTH domain